VTLQVGDDYPVWWNTNRPLVNGHYPARIIDMVPYLGLYKNFFTHVLWLEAPETKSGKSPMAVNLGGTT